MPLTKKGSERDVRSGGGQVERPAQECESLGCDLSSERSGSGGSGGIGRPLQLVIGW